MSTKAENMNNTDKKFYIANLIFKDITNSISEDEKIMLSQWLKEGRENIKIYKKLSGGIDLSKELKFYNSLNQNKALIETKKRIKEQKQRKLFIQIGYYAASVILPIAIFFFVSNLNLSDKKSLITKNTIISPNVPILTTDSGEEIELLSTGKDSIKFKNGETILREGKRLIYNKSTKKIVEPTKNTIKIPRGGIYHLVLEDGTTVWLNAATTFKFPSHFTGKKREVYLDGEAFFNVAKDKEHPFIVKSGKHKVKVLGTRFNVCAYTEDNHITTTLKSGKVNILSEDNILASLEPNQQSVYNKNTHKTVVSDIVVSDIIAWLSGYWYFNGNKIEDIMKKLARWYNVEVFYMNKEIGEERIVGRFKKARDIKEILNSIEKISNIKFETNKKTVIVKSLP